MTVQPLIAFNVWDAEAEPGWSRQIGIYRGKTLPRSGEYLEIPFKGWWEILDVVHYLAPTGGDEELEEATRVGRGSPHIDVWVKRTTRTFVTDY